MRFEGELQGGYGQISCVKNAQTLTEACWSRKASLGLATLDMHGSKLLDVTC
jgi:hypothetical protein